ncbi:hypothetical protein D3C87_1922330 [compost metagenome]
MIFELNIGNPFIPSPDLQTQVDSLRGEDAAERSGKSLIYFLRLPINVCIAAAAA